MTPFFDRANTHQLVAVAASWIGTPFRQRACAKRFGVDCVHLAAAIYRECGLPVTMEFPAYSLDRGSHAEHSLVTEWLDRSPLFGRVAIGAVPAATVSPGDLLCMNMGMSVHHVAVALEMGAIIHSIRPHGVSYGHIDEPAARARLAAVYRPVRPPAP